MSLDKQSKSNLQIPGDARSVPGTLSLIDSKDHITGPEDSGNWMPVSRELPGQSGDYLVLLRGQQYRVMAYARGSESFVPKNMNEAVTHWMMLPSKPR